MFMVVNTTFLRPLPYPAPDDLVHLSERNASGVSPVSYPNYLDWQRQQDVFAGLAVFHGADGTLVKARSELPLLSAVLASLGPKRENFGARLTIAPYAQRQVGMLSNVLWILLAMVGAALAVACLNVATLLFGVRLALGALPGQIRTLVLRRAMWQLGFRLTTGMALGWALNRPLQSIPLFRDIARVDSSELLLVGALVAMSVLLACWLPARRATRINPIEALRAG